MQPDVAACRLFRVYHAVPPDVVVVAAALASFCTGCFPVAKIESKDIFFQLPIRFFRIIFVDQVW